MYLEMLEQFGALALGLTPLSLIAMKQSGKFLQYSPKIRKTGVILTELPGILTKSSLIAKTLIFENYKIKMNYTNALVEINEIETKTRRIDQKLNLQKEEALILAATANSLCSHPHQKEIENIISKFFMECGLNRLRFQSEYEKIQDIPVGEGKKISTSVVVKKSSNEIFAFSKGNPSAILEKCSRMLVGGKKIDLNKNLRAKIRDRIKKQNKNGEKVIAFAFKGLPLKRLDHYSEAFTEHDLIFLGTIGLVSPLNIEIKNSLEIAKKLGIRTYITTWQRERQAIYASHELGMVNPNYFEVLTGEDLDDMSSQKLQKILSNKEKDYIFAELREKDKELILKTFQEMGETVAVVKKEKSTLENLVQNIFRARRTNLNHPKIFYHAISCKIGETLLILSGLILQTVSPLSILAILAIDAFVNLPLELALKADKPIESLSISKNRTILNGIVIGAILIAVNIFTLVSFGWNPGEKSLANPAAILKTTTTIFVLLSLIQIINAIIARDPKKSIITLIKSSNVYLLLTSIVSLMCIYILSILEPTKNYLDLSLISKLNWPIIFFPIILVLVIKESLLYLNKKFFTDDNLSAK